jgi:hypothetical protein
MRLLRRRELVPRILLAVLLGALPLASAPVRAAEPSRAGPHAAHWSLQPCRRPEVPQPAAAGDRAWVRNPIDAFILARLGREGLRPAPEADRLTLLRRLCFDLTGLPPTPEQAAAFLDDRSPTAYEALVERLLASSHYGERWGQHWLDVVRYAETEGFEYDRPRPGAWRYRDYVIGAFNADRPYDRFVLEQLAGDEVAPGDHEVRIAAGFLRLGAVRRNAGNQAVAFSRNEVLTEMTDSIGAVFLGLTVGCARCHDHKFDDIPQADYYRLQAFLAATQEDDVPLADAARHAEWVARTSRINDEIARLKQGLKDVDGAARQAVLARLREAERSLPPPLPTISSVRDVAGQRMAVHVLKRGDPARKEWLVGPRLPGLLAGAAAPELPADTPNPRLLLARWINAADNPLTPRVLVNRVWQYHFGRGLVETPNDFGVNGARPSHPELLDWLASEFLANGRRLKALHRLIVTSSTYRQSARPATPTTLAKDPDNRLLGRWRPRRLAAEEVRDAMLSAAGVLDTRVGGASIVLPVDEDLVHLLYDPKQWLVTPDLRDHGRRSVYLFAKRNLRLPFLQVFDQPDGQTSCPRRETSTHALQALEMLNGRTSNHLAEAFARRLEREAGADRGRQVELAFRLSAGRAPTPKERELALAFLQQQPLAEFALALFNLNAFLYVN